MIFYQRLDRAVFYSENSILIKKNLLIYIDVCNRSDLNNLKLKNHSKCRLYFSPDFIFMSINDSFL